MSGLVVFTHLRPQQAATFAKALEGLDVELLPVHQYGRSSTYRRMAKATGLAGVIGDRQYDWLVAACYSAGYGFWSEVLKGDWDGLDGIVTVDSWYASTLGTPAAEADLKDLVEFAQRAREGDKLLWMTYSSIRATGLGYAHTSEVAEEVAQRVGGAGGGFFLEPQRLGHGPMLTHAGPGFLARALENLL